MITSEMINNEFIFVRKQFKALGYEIITIRFIDEEFIFLVEKKYSFSKRSLKNNDIE